MAAGLLALVSVIFGIAAIAVDAQSSAGEPATVSQSSSATRSSPDAPGPDDVAAPPIRGSDSDDDEATADPAPRPVRVVVPTAGIDATLEPVGVDEDRRLVVPPPELAGWFEGRPVPGEIGPAVLVGHIDSLEGPAVFHGLDRVEVGDQIHVTDDQGEQVSFAVERVEVVAKTAFPTSRVYDPVDRAEVRLITCWGPFDPEAGSYRDNIIVYGAALDAPSPADPR